MTQKLSGTSVIYWYHIKALNILLEKSRVTHVAPCFNRVKGVLTLGWWHSQVFHKDLLSLVFISVSSSFTRHNPNTSTSIRKG